jgi:hypothetical protein
MLTQNIAAGGGDPVEVSLDLGQGQAVRLDAFPGPDERGSLDLYLRVLDAAGNLMGEADDSDGTLNPRVDFVSTAGGRYTVEVGGYSAGVFSLIARERRPILKTPLDLAGGAVERPVSFPEEEGALFTIVPTAGGTYDFTLAPQSEGSVDPVLELFAGDDISGEPLFRDDDSLGNLGSRIVADVSASSTYTIRVTNLSASGAATLKVAQLREQNVVPIDLVFDQPGSPVSFSSGSPVILEDAGRRFSPYAMFRLPQDSTLLALMQAGKKVTLRADGEGLDPFLEVGFVSPFGFSAVRSNDDSSSDDVSSVIVLDPAALLAAHPAENPESWWKQLRIRASAPQGANGTMLVTASTGDSAK